MKKTILISLLLLGLNNVYAQTKDGFIKGNSYVAGSFNLQTKDSSSVRENSVKFSPTFGYFISDNLVLGGRLSVGQNKTTDSIVIKNNTTFSFGVFARYYMSPKSRFSVFGQLGLNYNTKTEKLSKSSLTGFDIGLAPGISYFLSDHFAVEATFGRLGFETSKPSAKDAVSKNVVNFDVNLSTVGFGLIYKF